MEVDADFEARRKRRQSIIDEKRRRKSTLYAPNANAAPGHVMRARERCAREKRRMKTAGGGRKSSWPFGKAEDERSTLCDGKSRACAMHGRTRTTPSSMQSAFVLPAARKGDR